MKKEDKQMNARYLIMGILGMLCASCNHSTKWDMLVQEGVSRELAEWRKANTESLAYEIYLRVPESKDEAVSGEETICLTLDGKEDIILDFRESPSKIRNVKANGEPCEWNFVNEHIVIPSSFTRNGRNEISIEFEAGDQSLNRRDDYAYTLFVPDRARTAFPCMDQPDLKATFSLTLDVPEEWTAVSNAAAMDTAKVDEGFVRLQFAPTEPLPTYLFAFAAGRFERVEYEEDGHRIGILHRETDPQRLAQLPDIGHQVVFSLKWQEDFTGVEYPFGKYDLVILPGFQFGGMEHTGATFYNDNTIFLPPNPTPDELLNRAKLISHETSHMWFGDAVTMKWFDDVWTKEVFANYFAAEITAPLFPEINHDLEWMKTFTASAMSEDRTEGVTAIRQPLGNLRHAGLVYNSIIYNKAPVMMRKLVELTGRDAFQRAIRRYVETYKYGNATWDDLVALLDAETEEDVRAFSDVWVNEPGMPTIYCTLQGDSVAAEENDPLDRGLRWPQTYTNKVVNGQILPNYDGRGYGFFTMDDGQLQGLLAYWPSEQDKTARQSLLMTLQENYLHGRIKDERWLQCLTDWVGQERDALTASTMLGYMNEPMLLLPAAKTARVEERLRELSASHPLPSVRTQILRLLYSTGKTEATTDFVKALWQDGSPLLSDRDNMAMAYELAIRLPGESRQILARQAERISNPDRREEFALVSRAVSQDRESRDSLFRSLSVASNRRIEPWTLKVLYYLNHPLRQKEAVQYIYPALELLPEIQHTGDIFFPANWCHTLLSGHRSQEARQEVDRFLDDHTDYPQLLTNKILLAKYSLFRGS